MEHNKKTYFGEILILGAPNAGKSTLINAFFKHKISIITDKPQTTRHSVKAVLNDDNCQIVFSDAPGIYQDKSLLHKELLKETNSLISLSDKILLLVPANNKNILEKKIINKIIEFEAIDKLILVISKIDLINKNKLITLIEQWKKLLPNNEIIPISALKNDNVTYLYEYLKKQLPEKAFEYSVEQKVQLLYKNHFFIEEIIREKAMIHLKEELPYSILVKVIETKNNSKNYSIEAELISDQESHKPILIGKGAQTIKLISMTARKELEIILQKPIFLNLTVKIVKNWKNQPEIFSRPN